MKKFLLGTSNYAQEIQSHIDLYVTTGKHNEASSRRKLDPIEKNVWGTGNLLAFFFKGVSNFDAQNPIIGSLLREINLEKKKITSDLISKAPQINDVISRRRFENLRKTDEPYNANNEDDNNDYNDGLPGQAPLGSPPSPINQQLLLYHLNRLLLYFHLLKIYLHHHPIVYLQEKTFLQVQMQPQENK